MSTDISGPAAADIAEFADEYTAAERTRIVVTGLAAGGVIVGAGKLWLFPWLRAVSASAGCQSILGIPGTTVLGYGLFVGLPLLAGLFIIATVGRRGLRILREGRVPPSREKVFRPTRIKRGPQARAIGTVQLLAAAPMLALSVWGTSQAGVLAHRSDGTPGECAAGGAFVEGTAQEPAARR
jgi:hypothetical protein